MNNFKFLWFHIKKTVEINVKIVIFDLWTGIIIIISFHKSKMLSLRSGWRSLNLAMMYGRNVYVPNPCEWILRLLWLHLLHLPSKTHTVPYPVRNIDLHCVETGILHSSGIVPKKMENNVEINSFSMILSILSKWVVNKNVI